MTHPASVKPAPSTPPADMLPQLFRPLPRWAPWLIGVLSGLVLFVLTFAVNFAARAVLARRADFDGAAG